MSYLYQKYSGSLTLLERYDFKKETQLQDILAKYPEIILDLSELEINDSYNAIICREYPTSRGFIDILLITKNGEIIIVETKLLKNPESTRTVIAQVIDYIKALSIEDIDDTISKIKKISKSESINEKLIPDISKNIKAGNFSVVVVGDFISPNVLGMVESIQSAPHLSFSIYLVELNVYELNDNIIITPKTVANTYEIERSVIRLNVNFSEKKYTIESETPSKERGKGNKPILTWEQYVGSIEDNDFRVAINRFRNAWIENVGNSINMGVVGFSAGVKVGDRRIPIQFVYNSKLSILSEKIKDGYNIPDKLYSEYKDELKFVPNIYDEYIIGNKVEIPFEKISISDLQSIFNAAISLANKLKEILK